MKIQPRAANAVHIETEEGIGFQVHETGLGLKRLLSLSPVDFQNYELHITRTDPTIYIGVKARNEEAK